MIDTELLELSKLQRKYADLFGEIQKVLRRMMRNECKADDADRKHLVKTQKKMKQVERQMKELAEKIKARRHA